MSYIFYDMQPTSPDFTPQQSRAARALLAWSQQDLARAANVAASTVADFERGFRTPVPNNIDAMRKALENAAIRFLPGGAVIGPKFPVLSSSSTGGIPIRLIDATDLSQWADRRDGQATMPTLISKLVRAAQGTISDIRFPSDEGIQHSGWDGITNAEEGSQYVPKGMTGWEIGTQRQGIAGKATGDFENRSSAPNGLSPSQSTFIFVTPRHWPKREEWAREKRALQYWHDVKAYDASDLVHWIELYPAIGQWLKTLLGKPSSGLRLLEEAWQEWSLATQWPLSQDLILADRDESAAEVLKWLRSPASVLALQAESAEEVSAFFYAAIMQLPHVTAQHYLARVIIASNPDAARTVGNSITPSIIVLLDPEPGLAERLSQRGHYILLAYGSNADNRGNVRLLERPSRAATERALQDMGLPDPRAEALARDAGRSLAILRRLIPTAPGRMPKWAADKPPQGLMAAMLAGSWDEQSDTDKEAIAELSGLTYPETSAQLAEFASQIDGPIRKVGSVWKMASLQDAWSLLAKYLTSNDIDRFQDLALNVFGSHDPRFDLDPDDRWLAQTRNIGPQYSAYLRHGLGQTLILLSLFPKMAPQVSGSKQRAESIVRKLLANATPAEWWSLSADLRLLAEAAPAVFLDAIEESLERPDRPIRSLFGTDGGPFGSEHLSNLLWALESLAWLPANLRRVSEVLAKLDEVDPGGKFSNRPSSSLAKIFVLWSPQTNATLNERVRVIDSLRKATPAAAWRLLLATLPNNHGFLIPSAQPRWRDYSVSDGEPITYASIAEGAEEITNRLLLDVGTDVTRWEELLSRVNQLAPDGKRLIRQLTEVEPNLEGSATRTRFWEILRSVLHRHRQFRDASWVLNSDDLQALERIYNRLEPSDPVDRIAWLFSPAAQLPDPGTEGWRSEEIKVALVRRTALADLLGNYHLDELFRLARTTPLAGYVGGTLTELQIDDALRDQILERALLSHNTHERDLAHGLIFSTYANLKEPWAARLLERARLNSWGGTALLTILRAIPLTKWAWQEARKLGQEIETEYWKRAGILWMEGDVEDIIYMARKLIEVGRARECVHFLGHHLNNSLPPNLLLDTLHAALHAPTPDQERDQNDLVMFQHYIAEIFKYLDAVAVSEDDLLPLEWAYLPILEHSGRPARVLIDALSRRPDFFIQVLSAVFKPTEESGIVEPTEADPQHVQAMASRAYDLLRLWDRIPGTSDDGQIDGAALEAWVKEARKLAASVGRAEIADQKIGEALSASSPDAKDGVWPAIPVREVIEITRSKALEVGLAIGHSNRRGVTTRLPTDGGAQERDLAGLHRRFAEMTALDWPRTSAVLERIADDYLESARWHDEQAERLDWRS